MADPDYTIREGAGIWTKNSLDEDTPATVGLSRGIARLVSLNREHNLQALWKDNERAFSSSVDFSYLPISDYVLRACCGQIAAAPGCMSAVLMMYNTVPEDDLKHDRTAHGVFSALLYLQSVRAGFGFCVCTYDMCRP